jgi:hypothetical protein
MPLPILLESSAPAIDVFDPWGGADVDSWSALNERVDAILERHGNVPLVWRGVGDASWGLYSSLYRRLKKTKARVTEADMVREEQRVLGRARSEWRFDQMSALEIFAHIQHYGGPTRLLDVTENPLIAAWFAVEQQHAEDGTVVDDADARVFCFYVGEYVTLTNDWGGRSLPWEGWSETTEAVAHDWGSGKKRRVWRPPAYNPRISAQNAGFLIDGVPFTQNGSNRFARRPGTTHKWGITEIRDTSSIPIRLNDHTRQPQSPDSTPAFTFKIKNSARAEIRDRLERNYGYSTASLYGDLFGLAQYAAPRLPR